MNIFRRIILIISVSAILVAAVYGFLWIRTQSFSDLDPMNSIPESFLFCVKTSDLAGLDNNLRTNNEIWKEFKSIKEYTEFQNLDKFLAGFDSLRQSNLGFSKLFENEAFLSIHKIDAGFNFLASFDCSSYNATEELMKIVDSGSSIEKFKFENQTYYQIISKRNIIFKELFFYEHRGIFSVTESLGLLKESIRTINDETNMFESPPYKRIIETAGTDVLANVYLNFEEISKITGDIFKKDIPVLLSEILTASVLDVEIYSGKIIFNGFTSFDKAKSSHLLKYKKPIPNEKSLNQLFPPCVAYFNEIKGYSKTNSNTDKTENEKEFLANFSELTNENSAELICNKSRNNSSYLFLSLISGGNTWDFLSGEAGELLGNNFSPEFVQLNIADQNYPVGVLSSNSALELMGFKNNEKYTHFAVYENTLIFAESLNDIQYIIHQNKLGNTLANDRTFQKMEENFASNSNIFSFFNPSAYIDIIEKNLNPGRKSFLSKTKNSWAKFNALSFQSTKADDLHYFRIFMNFSDKQSDMVNTIWKRKLDTLSIFKPAIVRNYNTGEKEIFIQDLNRNIYLISSSGDILWENKTDGPILSEIFQVDYYNNGKLQYLFNTAKRLYIVDRNGNQVEKFPIEFREKAAAGVNVFDYDKSGDWRIAVPLINKDILMYNKEGKVVPGWRFPTADHLINQFLLHEKVGDKDYIIARDSYQLYFLDRKGKKRIKPERQIHFSEENPVFIDKSGGQGNEKIIASDEKGSVYYFYFNEKVEKVFDNNFSPDHYFIAENIVGDQRKELIFTDIEKLVVYDEDKNLIFERLLPENIDYRPVVYSFGANDKKIGVVATKTGLISLFNNNGTLYDGFPLSGSSLFSISSFPGLKNRFNLIVNNKDNFLYNYSVK